MEPRDTSLFNALVLAADRTGEDPVARAAGVPCKVLAPVAGVPLVLRVLAALEQSQWVAGRTLCGPPWDLVEQNARLHELISCGQVGWTANQATPSTSTYAGLRVLPDSAPVLVTTGDHAFLRPEIIDHFCVEARASGCDLVVGFASYERILEAFPGTRRTVVRLRDGGLCGCNLFAFLTARGRSVADFWVNVEQHRKRPLRMLGILGWMLALRYVTGRLSLPEGLERISRRVGARVGAVMLPFPEVAVDVDTVDDWRFVQAALDAADGQRPQAAARPPCCSFSDK